MEWRAISSQQKPRTSEKSRFKTGNETIFKETRAKTREWWIWNTIPSGKSLKMTKIDCFQMRAKIRFWVGGDATKIHQKKKTKSEQQAKLLINVSYNTFQSFELQLVLSFSDTCTMKKRMMFAFDIGHPKVGFGVGAAYSCYIVLLIFATKTPAISQLLSRVFSLIIFSDSITSRTFTGSRAASISCCASLGRSGHRRILSSRFVWRCSSLTFFTFVWILVVLFFHVRWHGERAWLASWSHQWSQQGQGGPFTARLLRLHGRTSLQSIASTHSFLLHSFDLNWCIWCHIWLCFACLMCI